MRISVIIPVYNVSLYIDECLESVAAQTYKDIECILIDDCGTDDSMAKVRSFVQGYKGQVEFLVEYHDRNKGLSEARNTGIKRASGDYIYFLDSDDFLSPDCLESLTECLKSHPEVEMVQGSRKEKDIGAIGYYEDCEIGGVTYLDNPRDIRKAYYTSKLPVMAWNKLIKRSVLMENELYFPAGLYHEDLLWTYFLAKNLTCMAVCNKVTYIYRHTDSSITRNVSTAMLQKRKESLMYISETIGKDMLDNGLYRYRDYLYLCYIATCAVVQKLPSSTRRSFSGYVWSKMAGSIRYNRLWDYVLYLNLLPPLRALLQKRWYLWRFNKYVRGGIGKYANGK